MNILLLGSLNTVFVHSYAEVFRKNGCNVYFANTSSQQTIATGVSINLFEKEEKDKNSKLFLKRLVKFCSLDKVNFLWKLYERREYNQKLSSNLENELYEFIKKKDIDVVFSFWGTTLKKEVESISNLKEKLNKKVKFVHCVNTYPVRYDLPKKYDTSYNVLIKDKHYFDKFDSLICSTEGMKRVFRNVLGYNKPIYVQLDYLDNCFFTKKTNTISNQNKQKHKIIFLGNVDFSNRTLDDVSKQIIDIADQNIDVWVQSPCSIEHPNIKTFEPFTYQEMLDGKLGDFISGFSASIVLYNDLNNLRTSISYPTRFALATSGRRPILIPKDVFDGIENIKDEFSLSEILVFKDISEIKSLLDEVGRESNSEDLCDFFVSDYNSRDKFLVNFVLE